MHGSIKTSSSHNDWTDKFVSSSDIPSDSSVSLLKELLILRNSRETYEDRFEANM